jgi:N4-(beta-N-acetylglucosaminyl)-L-asparaginase
VEGGGTPDREGAPIWEAWKKNPDRQDFWNHDTIGMVAIDAKGDLCAGTSTSGLAFKIKGRVGDVAIPGAGATSTMTSAASPRRGTAT